MGCRLFFSNIQNQQSLNNGFLRKELNLKMNVKKNSNQLLTRSGRLAIDREVLEFCLMEVQRAEYNF